MNVLFVMQSPGYIRNYEDVLRLLLERGHHVHLGFEKAGKYNEFLTMLDLQGYAGRLSYSTIPKRHDEWQRTATDLRVALDYTRYLHPRFRRANGLRRRVEKKLPESAVWLTKLPTLPAPTVGVLERLLLLGEEAIPSSAQLERYLRQHTADIMLLTPLITIGSAQTDVLKSAKAVGLRSVLCVGSWDHLTCKGLIRIPPDHVLVWNEIQRWEATSLHGIPRESVLITGAQLFDHWFDRGPSKTAHDFKEQVGLNPESPFVLFCGSTSSITPAENEIEFVQHWIAALRRSDRPELREIGVLIRPHPYNALHWEQTDISKSSNVSVWRHANVAKGDDTEEKAMYFEEAGKAAYFDSMYHASAVIAVNSSALVEASIVGAPVFTVIAPDFAEMQSGTLHFRYLLPKHGGPLHVARSLSEHTAQLAEALHDPVMARLPNRPFVKSFVRPHGLSEPATPIFVETVERLAALGPHRRRPTSPLAWPMRRLLHRYTTPVKGKRPNPVNEAPVA